MIGQDPSTTSTTGAGWGPPPPAPPPPAMSAPAGALPVARGTSAGMVVGMAAAATAVVVLVGALVLGFTTRDDGDPSATGGGRPDGVSASEAPEQPADEDGEDVSTLALEVGNCYDALTLVGTVGEVEALPCDGPHEAEVYEVFDTEIDTEDYPSGQLDEEGRLACNRLISDVEAPEEVEVFYLIPSPGTWEDGDREIICSAVATDGSMDAPLE